MKADIIFAGVGGQGLVLATQVVTQAAMFAGHEVCSSDVYGLAQRGGAVWGMVRIGAQRFLPLIPRGEADILVALEQLEGLRWLQYLAPESTAILNDYTAFPTPVLLEKEEYPEDIPGQFKAKGHDVRLVPAPQIARKLGNQRLVNTVLIGALADKLALPAEAWEKAIIANVPAGTGDLNLQAFGQGDRSLVRK